jgi:lipoprotein-releasing system ATP-binding protein
MRVVSPSGITVSAPASVRCDERAYGSLRDRAQRGDGRARRSHVSPRHVMKTTPFIELVDVNHESRSGRSMIRGACLRIGRGEIIRIRGGAESDRTTLLGILAGLVAPSRGTRLSPFSCDRVAFLPQRPSFLLGLTAVEHVMLGMLTRGLRDETTVMSMAKRGLVQAGLAHMSSMKMGDLAPIERRLVIVAEALAVDPALVCVDEGYDVAIAKLVSVERALVVVAMHEVGVRFDRTLTIDGDGGVHAVASTAEAAA